MASQHGRLGKIEGHPYYFQDPISKRIYYIKKPVKIATKVTSIKEAKRIAELELIKRYSQSPDKVLREKQGIKNPRLRDIWPELLEQREQRSAATKKTYDVSWKYGIEPFWGNLNVSDVSQKMVSKYESWYMREHSTRYFYNTRKSLTMFFNFLKENGYIENVPKVAQLDLIINQKIRRAKVGRVYDDSEVDKILKNISERYALAVLMARHMGMRKMEILSREWKDVSFKDATISVWSFKNKRWRKVPLPEKVYQPLKSFYTKHKSERFIFPMASNSDAYMSGQLFDKQWKRAQKLAEIEGWDKENAARFHDLRHTFATQTAQENWPPMVACKVLDMSLKEYERTYVHINDADMVRWMTGRKKGD